MGHPGVVFEGVLFQGIKLAIVANYPCYCRWYTGNRANWIYSIEATPKVDRIVDIKDVIMIIW